MCISFERQKLAGYIKGNKFTLIVFVLLFVSSLIFRLSIKEADLKSLSFALLNAIIIFLAFRLFAKTFLRIPAILVLSALIAIDAGLFYAYKNPMNFGVIASIFETDIAEAYSMSKLVLLPGLLALGLSFFLLYKSSLEIRKKKTVNPVTSMAIILIGTFLLPVYLDMKAFDESPKMTMEAIKTSAPLVFAGTIPVKYPFILGDIFITAAYLDEMARFRENSNKIKTLPEGITYNSTDTVPGKIIVIIGESSLRSHYSLYGYNAGTTPFLDSISTHTHLLNYYDNVISPASYTRDALRICMSFATPLDKDAFFDKKDVLNMASDAGYRTSWISNQTKFGLNDTHIGMIAANADTSIYLEDIRREDLKLIPLLKEEIKPGTKQFIVLHLNGSHMAYKDQYDEEDTKALGSTGPTIDYDKTIHHTDRVLKGVFGLIENLDENVLIYYTSDHGEIVNEGHAKLNGWKCQFEVPLIIMQNKPVKDTDSIISKYYSDNLLNTSTTPYILGEFMGYQVNNNLIEKVKEENKYIYQVDGSVITFDKIKD